MLTTPLSVSVQFDLPDWCADERFEVDRVIYFPPGHAWAGSYDRTERLNRMSDALFRLKGMKETCLFPGSCWCVVEFEFSTHLQRDIIDMRDKLHRMLSRYKEARLAA